MGGGEFTLRPRELPGVPGAAGVHACWIQPWEPLRQVERTARPTVGAWARVDQACSVWPPAEREHYTCLSGTGRYCGVCSMDPSLVQSQIAIPVLLFGLAVHKLPKARGLSFGLQCMLAYLIACIQQVGAQRFQGYHCSLAKQGRPSAKASFKIFGKHAHISRPSDNASNYS